jgi:transposase
VNVQVSEVPVRRLVGIDLGIASAHTVRILDGTGQKVAAARCVPARDSLLAVEARALTGTPVGTRLEVVFEPTGPAWFPVARFFTARGHKVFRVSSAKAADLRKFYRRHTKSNGIDADTLARLPLADPGGLTELTLGEGHAATLDRRVRACDRLTQQAARHKVRIKDLTRQLMPMTPLTGDLGKADLAVLERCAGPRALLSLAPGELTTLITQASHGQLGPARARAWISAAQAAIDLYGPDDPAMAYADLAAEVATEVRLLHAIEAELTAHAAAREDAYQKAGPGQIARTLPGLGEIGGPAMTTITGPPARFASGHHFKSYLGLAPRASETGDTDRKGEPMSKAGPSLGRATMIRAADTARKHDPQLASIYHTQMTQRGACHLKGLCIVAGHLALRLHATALRGSPYQLRDTDGSPVTPEEAKKIIAARWTVPEDIRKRRRSRKTAGKAPQAATTGPDRRGNPPRPRSSRPRSHAVKPATRYPGAITCPGPPSS